MNIKKGVTIAIVILVLIGAAYYVFNSFQQDKSREELAKRILSSGYNTSGNPAENPAGDSSGTAPGASTGNAKGDNSGTSIADLKASIAKYEKKIEQNVSDAAKTGSYWKILAIRYQDQGLHGEALVALQHAIYYYPLDPTLQYYTGLSAGILAKSAHDIPDSDSSDRLRYFALAEEAYLRAIELDGNYLPPRYGLGVLYVFELNRPQDAIPHLQRYLEVSRGDVDTMFVLARAYYMLKNYQNALDLYDRIIAITKDPQKKADAQNNRTVLLGQMRG